MNSTNDAEKNFLEKLENYQPSETEVQKAFNSFILSASGWRKVFAVNGDEENSTSEISIVDGFLTILMAEAFYSFLTSSNILLPKEHRSGKKPTIIVASDARPTGTTISDIFIQTFVSKDCQVQHLGVAAAPEVMAHSRRNENAEGFVYVSASHNPVGHNGVKFGLKTGGVLTTEHASKLKNIFISAVRHPEIWPAIIGNYATCSSTKLEEVYSSMAGYKKESFDGYMTFTLATAGNAKNSVESGKFAELIRNSVTEREIGILGELNGSARGYSIDRVFLNSFGIRSQFHNNTPGDIVHRIVPEGSSLDLCKELLEKAHKENNAFILGYVPDNDGDRGNIVYINNAGNATSLEAQQVFALAVLGELAFLNWQNRTAKHNNKLAVALNGPTSMRIEAIAAVFGAKVFRAEVGEANVVQCAEKAREMGYTVRILGEGSNGGNITHPSAVRDPLQTLMAIVKLLTLRGQSGSKGLFEEWCNRTGRAYSPDFLLDDILDALPVYTTTSAYEDRAIMKITTLDHGKLKENYETNFPTQWETRKTELLELGNITGWYEIQNEGTEERTGIGSEFRSPAAKGGLKIVFTSTSEEGEREQPTAYIWMRGSGTEPVFRVLADVMGDNKKLEEYLLEWQREMVKLADQA